MKVKTLYIYPVKSLAGIEVSRFSLDDFGPQGDRRWMIVDGDNRFVTQRRLPQLANVYTALQEGVVVIDVPGEGLFPLTAGTDAVEVTVWRDQVVATAGADRAAEALSRYCGETLRLVYMPDSCFRRVDPGRVSAERRVGFADGFPLLVVNQSSLDELNSRLESPVDMRRFRPNIVVEGVEAWAEDTWQSVSVGKSRLDLVKPCSRCVMTTVNPDTGEKDSATQPLKTLASYRKTRDGVIFGQNAVHQKPGEISVGDEVTVLNQEN
ncbi:MOSC domain-containing protein [Marinobacter sp.]|nr:MOSC domain-containing protein [Marinobacter sp.]MCW9011849.1 MOSC domain-containing protein [Marinobacter sp.]